MQQNCYLLYADQLSIIVTRASAARIVSARYKAAVQKALGNSVFCDLKGRPLQTPHQRLLYPRDRYLFGAVHPLPHHTGIAFPNL